MEGIAALQCVLGLCQRAFILSSLTIVLSALRAFAIGQQQLLAERSLSQVCCSKVR
jgi:hypothetical protein